MKSVSPTPGIVTKAIKAHGGEEYLTKNKDGIPFPKKVLVKHDGKTFLEAEMVESTMLEAIDEAEFKK